MRTHIIVLIYCGGINLMVQEGDWVMCFDLSDEEWSAIGSFLPAAKHGPARPCTG